MNISIKWLNKDEDYGELKVGNAQLTKLLRKQYPKADGKRIRVRRIGDTLTFLYKHQEFYRLTNEY